MTFEQYNTRFCILYIVKKPHVTRWFIIIPTISISRRIRVIKFCSFFFFSFSTIRRVCKRETLSEIFAQLFYRETWIEKIRREGKVDRENKRSEDFKQSVPKWIFIVDVLTMEWIRTKIIQNTCVNYVLEQELSPSLMAVPNEIRNCV